jgi:hypothetical protein
MHRNQHAAVAIYNIQIPLKILVLQLTYKTVVYSKCEARFIHEL